MPGGPMIASGRMRNWKRILWLFVLGFAAGALPAENRAAKPGKITVTILAVSTRVRSGYAGDEDTYLASLVDRKGNRQLIKLSDWRPSGWANRAELSVGRQFRLIAARTPWCDSTSRLFFLPTSAEERSQFFPRSNSEDGALSIPCYRGIHESIRAVRKSPPSAKPKP